MNKLTISYKYTVEPVTIMNLNPRLSLITRLYQSVAGLIALAIFRLTVQRKCSWCNTLLDGMVIPLMAGQLMQRSGV